MKIYILGVISLSALLVTGCATKSTSAPVKSSATPTTIQSPSLSNPKVGQQGKYIIVSVLVSNTTEKAIPIQPSEFAFISGAHVLSPTSNSQIPSQIPANSKVQISLSFDPSGQLSSAVSGKLAFQPVSDKAEEFVPLSAIKLLSSSSAQPANSQSKSTQSGTTVTFINDNGDSFSLPLVGIKATYGADIDPSVNPTTPIPPIHFNIPSSQASQLAAYWVNEGYKNQGILFLGPRGWIPTQAASHRGGWFPSLHSGITV